MADANRNIHTFLDEVNDAVDEQRLGSHLLIAAQEIVQEWGEIATPEQDRGGDGELADRLGAARDQQILRLLGCRQDIATALQVL